jgi:hypothetical protein
MQPIAEKPPALPGFDLTQTPWLSGFVVASTERLAAATYHRYFRGPWEFVYYVLRFDSAAELRRWDDGMRRSAPGWFSPFRSQPKEGIWRREYPRMGGVAGERPTSEAVFVANHAVIVSCHYHREMVRRDPATAKNALTVADARRRVTGVTEELIRRARKSR